MEHGHGKVIDLAKNELPDSNRNVSEIAFELGFEHSQYFSRLFKKQRVMTPSKCRKISHIIHLISKPVPAQIDYDHFSSQENWVLSFINTIKVKSR